MRLNIKWSLYQGPIKELNWEIGNGLPIFIMELFEDENPKNIYVIKRKLAQLHATAPGLYELDIKPYKIRIRTPNPAQVDSILRHETVNVDLIEMSNTDMKWISLLDDSRFKNYKPIQYNVFEGPNGIVNLSNGKDMPLLHLCELIRLLYRLSNLTAFA